jgi:hypothetical protein
VSRDEARAAAQVLLAFADGQEVECIAKGNSKLGNTTWIVVTDPQFDFSSNKYRIKPREWWVPEWPDGKFGTLWESPDECPPLEPQCKMIKVREVIQ